MGLIRTAVILALAAGASTACTGFAVYSGEAWYGMNFDYPPEAAIRFDVSPGPGGGLITMSFAIDGWYPTAGMNGDGVFATLQYQCPFIDGVECPGEGEMFVYELFDRALAECSSMTGVEAMLDSLDLVNMQFLTLHALVADPSGAALIAETDPDGDCITRIDGDRLVMTNFRHGDVVGVLPEDITGEGADRYRRALGYIEYHMEDFGLEEALGALEAAVETDETWSTKVSMVFRPSERTMYLCIDSDFSRVWRISMEEGLIESWQGFDEHSWMIRLIRDDGITVRELRKLPGGLHQCGTIDASWLLNG